MYVPLMWASCKTGAHWRIVPSMRNNTAYRRCGFFSATDFRHAILHDCLRFAGSHPRTLFQSWEEHRVWLEKHLLEVSGAGERSDPGRDPHHRCGAYLPGRCCF